jgi:hypothetical protein
VQQQRRVERLVERRLERGDQAVRQVLDEADGVADQHARHALGVSARTVVSSVAKSLLATSTSLPVSARISVDLPALV